MAIAALGFTEMIIGTAGHIDHGKSALVTALTGRAVDRLAEERRRGITIDLNFAPLQLPGLSPIGIVDVPGHEDFVRTMVAGASGIDLVLLVVDAVEGIRPQTLEHLTIVEQLGIPSGIAVVTKTDLVESDWLDLVLTDVSERLAQSSVVFDEPLTASAVTGAGLDELRDSIARHAVAAGHRSTEDLFRLPVDRVFAVAGIGTVVTGTVWSGTIRVGDPVLVLPEGGGGEGLGGRIRSAECYGEPVVEVGPGVRTALGVTGVDRSDLDRGATIVSPGEGWKTTSVIDVMVELAANAPKPLRPRDRVRLHHGTAEVMARVYPRPEISPGGAGPARVVLEAPLAIRGLDRLVLRRYSPMVTIGGGWVIDPLPPRRAPWTDGLVEHEPPSRLEALVARRTHGVPELELPILLGLPPASASRIARETHGIAFVSGSWIGARRVTGVRTHLLETIARFHEADPSSPGISIETLRSGLGGRAWLADTVLSELADEGEIRVRAGTASLGSFRPQAGGGEAEVEAVVSMLVEAGLEAPTTEELSRAGLIDPEGAVRLAAARGLIVAVERNRYFEAEVLAGFLSLVREVGSERDGEVVPADLRERTGLSRKFLIPLLEWSDGQGTTRRDQGGTRRLN